MIEGIFAMIGEISVPTAVTSIRIAVTGMATAATFGPIKLMSGKIDANYERTSEKATPPLLPKREPTFVPTAMT